MAAHALWLVVELIGRQRYFLGKTSTAILQTITIGSFGLWWLIDLFLVAGMVNEANGAR